MNEHFSKRIKSELEEISTAGLFKKERIISSEQGAEITVNGKTVLNFCANNYLGLSSHPKVTEAAKQYIDRRGYGMSSVRFICGTQDIHKELEQAISSFLQTEDTILYAAAFDANGGVFEPLFNEEDAIISDALNHASIIDGVRLCKAQRYRYEHNNMEDLEARLIETQHLRNRIIVTDGSFSMDGTIAQLHTICDLADKYDAAVMIDECHSSGFIGKHLTQLLINKGYLVSILKQLFRIFAVVKNASLSLRGITHSAIKSCHGSFISYCSSSSFDSASASLQQISSLLLA